MAFYLGDNINTRLKVLDSEGWGMDILAAENHTTFDSGEFQAQSGTWWSANPIYRTQGWTSSVSRTSVAVGGGIIAVGDAAYDDSNWTNIGRVDLFDNKGNWFKSINVLDDTYDTTSSGSMLDIGFGADVAIAHGRLAVSTYGKTINPDWGKVYLFDLSGNYIDVFQTDSFSASVAFPTSIALGKRHLVVGDHLWDSSGAGSGDWNGEGKVHIFDLDNSTERSVTFGQAHRLGLTSRGEKPTVRSNVSFGWSVATGYGRIYVGAPGDNSDSTGSSSLQGVGSAFMLDFDGNFLGKFDAYDAVYPPGPLGSGAEEAKFGNEINVGQGMVAIGASLYDDTAVFNPDEGLVYITNLNGEHLFSVGKTRVQDNGIADSSFENWDTEFSNDYGNNYRQRQEIRIDNDRMYFPGINTSTTNVSHLNVLKLDGSGAEATVDHADSAIRGPRWLWAMNASGGLWANVDYGEDELNVQNSNLTLAGYLDKVLRKT